MALFYVETTVGCGIREARNAEQARRIAQREVDTMNDVQIVRKATDSDIAWVQSFGGYIPQKMSKTNTVTENER